MIALAWIGKMALVVLSYILARFLSDMLPDTTPMVDIMWLAGWLAGAAWVEFKIESK